MRPHTGVEGDRPVAAPQQYELLVKEADELGLTLPRGFRKFFTSNRLHHHLPGFAAWYFEPSRIIKCPSSIDNGAGGYILRFHWDQQSFGFAYLYMTTSGDDCAIYSHVDIYMGMTHEVGAVGEDRDPDILDGWDMHLENLENGQFTIAKLTFEEDLVSVYYEELLNFEAKPTKGFKDYVSHVYRCPAELEHLRERNDVVASSLAALAWEAKHVAE